MFVGNLPEPGEEAPSFPGVLGYKRPTPTLVAINPVLGRSWGEGGDGAWEMLLGIRTLYDLTSLSEPGLGFSPGKRPAQFLVIVAC